MLPPVRCFTCGKPIGGRIYFEFRERIAKGEDPVAVFEDLNIRRYCCRSAIYTSENYFEELLPYTTIRTKY